MKDNLIDKKPSVLLVDDDRLILATLSQGLKKAGYPISTAESVDEAEALLMSEEHPDLIILDVNMPGRSGLELTARLTTLDNIPFILLTAYNDQGIVDQATQSGALSYLVKPIDTPQLIPAIQAAWARAKEIKGLRTTSNQLQEALAAERDISIAVGITMVQFQLNRRRAFEKLRKTARDHRRRLSELAHEVIKACEVMYLQGDDKNVS